IVDSYIYNTVDRVNFEKLFPASTIFDNEIGGRVITFCGTPVSNFNYYEGFAFLNYSRKQQLIKMFTDMGELPIYYYGDEEVYLRVADMKNGDTFVALFNIGLDEI
ncbi:MAG: hypothetical protein J6U92_05355, partial [Clostridia bacterium]|nr:hypothetical protein [Clostridia bacterium]